MRPGREDRTFASGVKDEEGKDVLVSFADIPRLVGENFWRALELLIVTETLEHPPYSGGWLEWPYTAVKVLTVLRDERARYNHDHRNDHEEDE